VADSLARALDATVGVRQRGAIGELQVDVRSMRDDRELQRLQGSRRSDGEQAVARIEPFDGARELGEHGVAQRPGDVGDRGRRRVEMPVEGVGVR